VRFVALGELIKLTCFSYTSPTWRFVSYTGTNLRRGWQVKLKKAYIKPLLKDVIIPKANYEHQGIYYCRGTYSNQTKFHAQAEVFVGSMSIHNYN